MGAKTNMGNFMFKVGLLTSTAMTAVALLLSGAPAGAYAQTDMHVASRDPNTRFLCTYGQFHVSFGDSQQSGFNWFNWEDVAVPVVGQGQTVTRINVMEALDYRSSSWSLPSKFFAGIYSNSPSGFPGKLIAGGRHKARQTCEPITVKIPPTTLTANTKYWLKERTTHRAYPSSASFIAYNWYADPKATAKAYVQTGKGTCSSSGCWSSRHSSRSAWTKQTVGPWFRLK